MLSVRRAEIPRRQKLNRKSTTEEGQSEREGISQGEQRDLSERKQERLAKDRKRLISVILLPPRQDGEMGVFVSWEPSELHVNPLSL